MILKPQDLVVLLKMVAVGQEKWSYTTISVSLSMSASEVHGGIRRALAARLAVHLGDRIIPALNGLEEFIIHGLRYVFVPDRGEMTRGMPTAHAGPPLAGMLVATTDPAPVWPDPEGEVRGESFSPLYKSVPKAAKADHRLYELLVLVDAIRGGRSREREIAIRELSQRLRDFGGDQP